jgi:DNA invertase Pin-like site-specific DNA recombinase
VGATLRERGVGFRSLTEGFDTGTSGGQLIFHIFGALAAFEHALIVERTMAGLAAAKARGRRGGRPPALTAEQPAHARVLLADKRASVKEVAATLNVDRSTLYRALER